MSLRSSVIKHTALLSILGLVLVFVVLLLGIGYFQKYQQRLEQNKKQILSAIDKIAVSQNTKEDLKTLQYKELSPDEAKEAIVYKIKFDPTLYENYYQDYFPNNTIIAVKETKTGRVDYVFTGEERTGNPHWLGNSHIFFTTYCGTACQGIYLVNVQNKETRLGVLGYTFSEEGLWQTHFKDWFGEEFVFKGMVDKIESEIRKNNSYLIFKMQDGEGDFLGQKRFLFTGKKLIER